MYRLFILAKCELGFVEAVGNYIVEHFAEVTEVYSVTGEYDLLIKLPFNTLDEIENFVQSKLSSVPRIKETTTMLSFRVYGEDIGDFVS